MTVNRVILVGRLGKDPETKYMPNGEAVTNATLATSETWKGKDGEKQEKTEWHNLTFYRRLAEIAGEYLQKGSLIYVEGKIATRKWQDKDGKDRYTTDIIVGEMQMLGGRQDGQQGQTAQSQPASNVTPMKKPQAAGSFAGMDDDIPF